jgi:proline iminopeptidase
VVIVPGGFFLERDFAALSRTARVVFYDMRNRGRSQRIADSTRVSIQDDVRDLEAVRRYIGSDSVALVGWSYLGMMVMRYAADHPEHVTRVVQIGPLPRKFRTPFPDSLVAHDDTPVPPAAIAERLERARTEGLRERDPRAFCELDHEVNRARLVGNPALAARVHDQCSLPNEWPVALDRHVRWLFTTIVQHDPGPWERYERLGMPVLTIHGTQDRNAPYGGGREWAAHLPNGRLLTVRGAAHMPWIDAPDVVVPAVADFLGGNSPASAQRVR